MQISAANTPSTYSNIRTASQPEGVTSGPVAQDGSNSKNNGTTESTAAGTVRKRDKTQELSDDEQQLIKILQSRDREVRTHEAAHIAAAAGLARGGASFSFQTGPDGRAYAVGGEVAIDTSPVKDDPQATIQKAKIIRAAALAPAKPSGADRAVAAAASQLEASARVELAVKMGEEQQEELKSKSIQDKSEQDTEGSAEDSVQTSFTGKDVTPEINHYQDAINYSASSDHVGQLLNTSA